MTNSIQETLTSKDVKRRTVIKGAAWSVPVIAAAVATPLAAASGPKEATSFGTAGATVPGGSNAYYAAYGVDDNGDDAKIPAGTTIQFTVSPANSVGTVTIAAATNGSATISGPVNGVYTIVPSAGTTRVRLKTSFPSGTAAQIVISGSLGSSSANGQWT